MSNTEKGDPDTVQQTAKKGPVKSAVSKITVEIFHLERVIYKSRRIAVQKHMIVCLQEEQSRKHRKNNGHYENVKNLPAAIAQFHRMTGHINNELLYFNPKCRLSKNR
ncbi:MAG: hypothetical protein COT16_02980 [Elusimicrobia bacterium CG08_land_8_20_14_0_20_44_26]|nr:MAG: hypothetical protein COT16_02980 [Elusimicrobia bacterium CG08_land_8_20_14_0_20_44_26]